MNPTYNGRVNIIQTPDISKLFDMYDKIPANQCTTYRDALIGQWDETPLSKAYFSKENMQIIQNGIRAAVYYKSNQQYIVEPVDCDKLKTVMRSVYLTHSANQPYNIPQQIEQLNKIVMDYCVFQVYSEAQGYINYRRDVSTLAVPLSTPIVERQKDKNNYLMPNWF